MAGNVSGLHVFQADTGPEPLALLDTNYSALTASLNALSTFSNYYVDSGSVGSMVVTVPAPQTVSYVDGLTLDVKAAATNTGSTSINVNSLGSKTIVNPDGTNLNTGQIVLNSIITIKFSASANSFILVGGSSSAFTTVSIANQASFSAIRVAAQSLPVSTVTDLLFTSILFQRNGNNYVAGTGIFTAPQAGIYVFNCSAYFFFSGSANITLNSCYFSKNNNTSLGVNVYQIISGQIPVTINSAGVSYIANGSAIFLLAANDTIRVKADVGAGAGTLVLSANAIFSGYLLG